MDWIKSNRYIMAALGLAVVLLSLKWLLFSSNAEMALSALVAPPAADDPQFSVGALTWPAVLDIALSVLASIGVFVFTSAIKIAGGIFSSLGQSAPSGSLPSDLARAVASNDSEAARRLSAAIRRPYAIAELVAALEAGDSKLADALTKEISGLAGSAASE